MFESAALPDFIRFSLCADQKMPSSSCAARPLLRRSQAPPWPIFDSLEGYYKAILKKAIFDYEAIFYFKAILEIIRLL